MSAKRKHRNTTRLTAKERATAITDTWFGGRFNYNRRLTLVIQRALQAHARAVLRRDQRRDGK